VLVLAIDTAYKAGGAALATDENGYPEILGEAMLNTSTTHSRRLLSIIEFILEKAERKKEDLTGLAVTLGPGYFTGLRIGLATAQGIALGLDLPCAGVSCLRLVASPARPFAKTIWAVTDARRQLVYAAPFTAGDKGLKRLEPDAAMSPENLAKRIEGPAFLVGDGARAYVSTLLKTGVELAPAWMDLPRPGLLALLGLERLTKGQQVTAGELAPRYVRPSDAEIRFGLPLDDYRLIAE
jgi:tRNA threonylcarbamoyladenosine biosynthesis protein TsaB